MPIISQQAERITEKFGGASRLSKAIGVAYSTVHKWNCASESSSRGTDGVIPRKHIQKIRDAADIMGVELTAEDWAV